MLKVAGVIPALLTPFDSDGNVNVATTRDLVEYHISQGVTGFFVCGWTGEHWLLTQSERALIAETVIGQVRGRVPVIVHIGCLSTADSVRLAGHAKEAGADAISAKLPTVFSVGPDGIRLHFHSICQATDLPMYMYNEPTSDADQCPVALFRELFEEIPCMSGMKFTSQNLVQLRELVDLEYRGKRSNILSGQMGFMLPALSVGADGSISELYNMLPGLAVSEYAAFQAGEVQKAAEFQARFNRLTDIWVHFYPLAGISSLKGIMKLIGLDCGWGRPPHAPLSSTLMEQLKEALDQAGFWQLAVRC